MVKLVVTTVGKTQVFELDEVEKLLKVTTARRWQKPFEEVFELCRYSGGYREAAPEKARLFPLILAWSVVITGSCLMGLALYFFLQGEVKFVTAMCGFLFVVLAGPMPFFKKSIFYIFRDRAIEETGVFFLESNRRYDPEIQIEYLLKDRAQVFRFVEKFSALCRSLVPETSPQEESLAQCPFASWSAGMFQDEIRFFNGYGVETFFMDYKEIVPEIIYKKQSHPLRNFLCSYPAWLLWVIPAVIVLWGLIEEGWIIGAAMAVCALLPWALGIYLWKLRLPDENFYTLQWKLSSGIRNIELHVLKGRDPEAAAFMEKLQKRLKEIKR